MKITDTFRIGRLDKLNFVIEELRHITTRNGHQKDEWIPIGYYSSFEAALKRCRTLIIDSAVDCTEIDKVIDYLNNYNNVKINLLVSNNANADINENDDINENEED